MTAVPLRSGALGISSHRTRLLAVAVVTFAVVATMMIIGVQPASAASGYYCQDYGYIPGYTDCPIYVVYYVTSDSYNQALTYWPNDGDYVCETIKNSGGGWISRKCGQNQAVSGTVTVDTYDHQSFHVGNDSPKPHYVRGYWAADF